MYNAIARARLRYVFLALFVVSAHAMTIAKDVGMTSANIRGNMGEGTVDIVLNLESPAEGCRLYVANDETTPLVQLAPGRQVNQGMRLGARMSAVDFANLLVVEPAIRPTHRSLWIVHDKSSQLAAANSARLRVDLPAVDLLDDVRVEREPDETRLVVVAKNLLPGFRLHLSNYRLESGFFRHSILSEGPESGGRLAAYFLPPTQRQDGTAELTVVFPHGTSSGELNHVSNETVFNRHQRAAAVRDAGGIDWKVIYLENLDGSCSRMLRWAEADDRITGIDEFQAALPAPLDQQVVVPNVEGCTLDRAGKILSDNGLIPIPVHSKSLAPLPSSEFSEWWIRRQVVIKQGVRSGQSVKYGQQVLLTVKNLDYAELMEGALAIAYDATDKEIAGNQQAKESLDPQRRMQKTELSSSGRIGSRAPFDSLGVNSEGAELYQPDPEPIQDRLHRSSAFGGSFQANDRLPGNAAERSVLIRRRGFATVAGAGQIDIEHINPIEPQAGLFGYVDAFRRNQNGRPVVNVPAPAGVQAGESVDSGANNGSPAVTDMDALAVDVSLPYGPASISTAHPSTEVFIPDILGQTLRAAKQRLAEMLPSVAVVTPGERSADDIIVSQSPESGWSSPFATVELVTEVPVPNVSWMLYSKAVDILRTHDLTTDIELPVDARLGSIGQVPGPYTKEFPNTLPRGGRVQLKLGGVVPDVKGLTLREARSALERDGFVVSADPAGLPGDRVLGQHHEIVHDKHRQIAAWGDSVELELGRTVPDVSNMAFREAIAELAEAGLQAVANEDARLPWVVMDTEPKAGDVVGLDAFVKLSLRLPVPDVTGLTLGEARHVIENAGLGTMVANHLAQDDDVVREQRPRPGTLREAGSQVRLEKVVMRMPNVQGQSIGEASSVLSDQEQLTVVLDAGLIPADPVTAQMPLAGAEVERGSRVQILSKVQVPNVIAASCSTVSEQLVSRNLQCRFNVDPQSGNFVFHQSIHAGVWVNPRTVIDLVVGTQVPNLVGRTAVEASAAMLEAGLAGTVVGNRKVETENPALDNVSQVVDQHPAPGTAVARQLPNPVAIRAQVVTYVYIPRVIMADLRQRTKDQADVWLRLNKLDGQEVGRPKIVPTSDPNLAGVKVIWEQSIAPGLPVKIYSTVQFTMIQYQYVPTNPGVEPFGSGGMGGSGIGRMR